MFIYDILSKTKGDYLGKTGRKIKHHTKVDQKRFDSSFLFLLIDLCEYINTPKSVGVSICLRYLSEVSTVDLQHVLTVNPKNYCNHYDYLKDAQACAVLKKSNMFDKRYDETDLLYFYEKSESTARLQRDKLSSSIPFQVGTQIAECQEIIRSICGRLPKHIKGRFGPGSTFALKGKESSLYGKMVHKLECTALAEDACIHTIKNSMLHQHFSQLYHEHSQSCAFSDGISRRFMIDKVKPSIVPGDRFCIVDKDIFKPRGMCPQPTGNMAVQLGLADHLERSFFRFSGIKLCETDAIHKELVESGWDLFGTVDLSDASDSISLKLIELLFPKEWYECIRSITCRQTRVGNEWKPNSKAFAQGCGITFIIESIIFYAITYVTVQKLSPQSNIRSLISVYGDDIIVPIHYKEAVVDALELFSFNVNVNKSFGTESPFKESCGVDTFLGHNVRPVFLRSYTCDYLSITLLTNQVANIVRLITFIGDESAKRLWHRLRSLFEIVHLKPHFVPMACNDSEGIRYEGSVPSFVNFICMAFVITQRLSYIDIGESDLAFYLSFAGHSGRLFTRSSKVEWFGLRSRTLYQGLEIDKHSWTR